MSIFDKLFSNSDSRDNSQSAISWNELSQLQQLDTIVEESSEIPAIIFKHSTRCSISRMALKNFEREYEIEAGTAKPYFLDLIAHRDVSNAIASRFNVIHQSPQILVIKNGQSVYDSSHSDIDAGVVKGKV